MSKVTIAIYILLLSVSVNAQNNQRIVRGEVIDSISGSPVDFATVSLSHLKDSIRLSSLITDSSGKFSIQLVDQDSNFQLIVERIGYLTKYFTASYSLISYDTTIKIFLLRDPRTLKNVVVQANKPTFQRQFYKTIFNINNTVFSNGFSALELLSKAPGVFITGTNCITLNGKKGVKLLIDNKETYMSCDQLLSYLRTLNSSSIEKIEIISNPSSQYDAENVSGVINIVSVKITQNGYNGSIYTNQSYGRYYSFNPGFLINIKNKKLSYSLNYDLDNFRTFEQANRNSAFFNNESKSEILTKQQSTTFAKIIGEQNVLNFKSTYDLKRNQSITLNYRGYYYKEEIPQLTQSFTTRSLPSFKQIDRTIILSNNKVVQNTFNINYNAIIDTNGRTIDVNLVKVNHNSPSISSYTVQSIFGSSQDRDSTYFFQLTPNIYSKIFSTKVDYSFPLKKVGNFKTGGKLANIETLNDFSHYHTNQNFNSKTLDSLRSSDFNYKERIYAIYSSVEKEKKNFFYRIGMRAEYTITTTKTSPLSSNSETFSRPYLSIFPNFYLSHRNIKDKTLSLAYVRRINRPFYQYLNPFIYFIDKDNLIQGNPNLRPQFSNIIELIYQIKTSISLSVSYTTTNDIISNVTLQNQATQQNIISYKNLNRYSGVNMNMNYIKESKKFTTNTTLLMQYNRYIYSLDNLLYSTALPSFSINTSNLYKLDTKTSLMVDSYFTTRQASAVSYINPIFFVSFSARRSFKEKLIARLSFEDITFSNRIGLHSSFPMSDFDLNQFSQTRFIKLSLSYRFKHGITLKRLKTVEIGDEENRLRK